MSGNNPAPISDAQLAQLLADHQAQLLADHQAQLIANKRRNDHAADLRQRQRAEALGMQLD